jgi:phage terminase large subunit-like protein
LSDFEVTDEEEEEDIFTESEENVLRQEREETCKWYQSWDKACTSKEGCDAIMTQMTCPQIMRHLTV